MVEPLYQVVTCTKISDGTPCSLWFTDADIADIEYHWPQTFWGNSFAHPGYSTIKWTNMNTQRHFEMSQKFSLSSNTSHNHSFK